MSSPSDRKVRECGSAGVRELASRAAACRMRPRLRNALPHFRTPALSRAGAPTLALALALALAAAACARAEARPARELRVCADPNNLPFSNARGEGFENRIAELVARDLGARVRYTWWAQRRGFFRNTLKAGTCDVVIGMPATLEMAAATRPYYPPPSVSPPRRARGLDGRSFDAPRLRALKIGVQIGGTEGFNPPPVHALTRRGVVGNLK